MAFFRSRGVRILLGLLVLATLGVAAGAAAIYLSFLRDLPDLHDIEDYRPALASRVLDRHGRTIGEFYTERRRVAPLADIPQHAQLAFVAAEDSAFYQHSGIDYESILRAAWVDLRSGEIRQGASTITMQLVKQLLLSPERKFRRKLREMVLARQLEKDFSKDEILYLYLNQIYFGHGAWGIGEAARTYFGKPVEALTISESAMLAGLPQRPTDYSPFRDYDSAESRRLYVLERMLADGFIDDAQYETALADHPQLADPNPRAAVADAGYFVEEVRRYLFERLGGDTVLEGGLVVETTLDFDLQQAAVAALREGLEAHDHRQGYRGPLRQVAPSDIPAELEKLAVENELAIQGELAIEDDLAIQGEPSADEQPLDDVQTQELPRDLPLIGVVTEVDEKAATARVAFAPGIAGEVALGDVSWAREPNPKRSPRKVKKITKIFEVGDVASFVRLEDEPVAETKKAEKPAALPRLGIFQEPIVQGAVLSLEVATGDVMVMVGGYDYAQSQFNRATQARRQPGSAFKPFIYGAALTRDYTPVSTLYDRPAVYEDPISGFVWRPQNYGRHFYGPITMRTALAKSVNNATVHLFRDVGVDYVIDYARRVGIQSPLSRDLSLALGSSGVSLLELTSAYAVFPNGGRRVLPRFITRVTDRDGRVLLEDVPLGETPPPVLKPLGDPNGSDPDADPYPDGEILPTEQIISEEAAYLMCDLLKAVVVDPDGTGWRLKALKRPLAGKTGTTNDQMDAWFLGFSPDIATGVWVGHDETRFLGYGETGSRAAAPVWVKYMKQALDGRPVRDFNAPDGIVFARIDRKSGLLADGKSKDSYFQPFLEDTQPTEKAGSALSSTDTRRLLREDSF